MKIEVKGVEYELPDVDVSDWQAANDRLVHLGRVALLKSVGDLSGAFPPEEYAAMKREAMDRVMTMQTVPPDDVTAWANSRMGFAWLLHHKLLRSHPKCGVTLDDVIDAMDEDRRKTRAEREAREAATVGGAEPAGEPVAVGPETD